MFDAFGTLRAIRDDHTLTSAQKSILYTAVTRTSQEGQVKCSQEMLAADAGVSSRWVRTFSSSPAFERYFITEKVGRRRNLLWRLVTGTEFQDTGTEFHNTGTEFRPSTTSSTTTSTSSNYYNDPSPSESAVVAPEAHEPTLDELRAKLGATLPWE